MPGDWTSNDKPTSYYDEEAYQRAQGPSPVTLVREFIGSVHSALLQDGRISRYDKLQTILYDMWHSAAQANQENFYQALAKFFPEYNINMIRTASSHAKDLASRPVPCYTCDQGR